MNYYSATKNKNTIKSNVPAPYLRKSFFVNDLNKKYVIKISVVGIYVLFINGVCIDKGYLLPYRTNPNHIVYVDEYDISKYLSSGENVIGVLLGNGFSNSIYPGWNFDKLSWSHSPKIAFELYENDELLFDASSFKTHPSEYISDDFHSGEHIDSNKRIEGWNLKGFDDSKWDMMIKSEPPLGELLPHPNIYLKCYETVTPIEVIKGKDCYIFDFGSSFMGMYKITIKGEKDKIIKLFMNDAINVDKTIFTSNIYQTALDFDFSTELCSYDLFILSGEEDTFINHFSFKAGRFIALYNLSKEEVKNVKILFYKMSSLSPSSDYFKCDNKIINKLQKMTINSDISNFFYYPFDCPQREKNGWTGDTVLSCEQFLLNFPIEDILKEWMKSIIKAQNEKGTIPGIVPTDTWGFAWGNGPGWDMILFEVPYRTYLYSGDISLLEMVHEPIIKYLHYMKTKEDADGLYRYGLEDWVPIKTHTPVEIINTIECKHICDLAVGIFSILKDKENEEMAKEYSEHIRLNYIKHYPLLDDKTYTQTQLAMSIYYDMYDQITRKKALELLVNALKTNKEMDFGVAGNRAIWRVLGDNGYIDLAIKLMTQKDKVSFRTWIKQGGSTLFEGFNNFVGTLCSLPLEFGHNYFSFNHHFWGDISAFFYLYLAGLKIEGYHKLVFSPVFAKDIHHVNAKTRDIEIEIKKNNDTYHIDLFVPEYMDVELKVPSGYIASINSLNKGWNRFIIKKK